MSYVTPKRIEMRGHPELNEPWLQRKIAADPTVLGLGDLDVKSQERRQPGGGRLDMLLVDEDGQRYEVELQLGPTDESHIVRTLEYWDLERRRYPQYEHCAVLVAEDVTSRFLNVVSLFNGFVPIIAIQLRAYEVNGAVTLIPSRVVDRLHLGTDEEDDGRATRVDRATWAKKSTDGMAMVDRMHGWLQEIAPDHQLSYTKFYIGLSVNGVPDNFIQFRIRKRHVELAIRVPENDELIAKIDAAGLDTLDHNRGMFRIRLTAADLDTHEELVRELLKTGHDRTR